MIEMRKRIAEYLSMMGSFGGSWESYTSEADDVLAIVMDDPMIAASPALADALRSLLGFCEHQDFRNGVSQGVGHPDEGEHWAGVYMDAARAALALAEGSASSKEATSRNPGGG
jgi:hypothetical protein